MSERFQIVGTPAHDGQDDPPSACSVCGTTEGRFAAVATPQPHAGNRRVCTGCVEKALKRVGPPTAELHTRRCCGAHRFDDVGDHEGRYRIAAIWPDQSFAPGPYWLACPDHLSEALDALTPKDMTP